MDTDLPTGLRLARTTEVFDADTVPPGLQRAHRIAAGVWGQLVVSAGTVRLVFEDHADESVELSAGESAVIPPGEPHHVELGEGGKFAVEFHR